MFLRPYEAGQLHLLAGSLALLGRDFSEARMGHQGLLPHSRTAALEHRSAWAGETCAGDAAWTFPEISDDVFGYK